MESSALRSCELEIVRPVQPVAGYIGGKKNLSRRITAIIDRLSYTTYAEPFVGMGGIFLRRGRKSKAEAINDISGDVVTLFRILREHYPYFIDMLRWRLTSRADFKRLLDQDPAHLTDLQRAARFLYIQRLGFGGKVNGRTFGVDAKAPARFDVTKLEPKLAELAERLSSVVIEQLHYADFIRRYDHGGTLFYLDPPYFGCEDDYGPGVFGRGDFLALAEQLAGIKGRFLMSINDTPEIREVFAAFRMQAFEVTYTVGGGKKAQRAGELIITNLSAEQLPIAAND